MSKLTTIATTPDTFDEAVALAAVEALDSNRRLEIDHGPDRLAYDALGGLTPTSVPPVVVTLDLEHPAADLIVVGAGYLAAKQLTSALIAAPVVAVVERTGRALRRSDIDAVTAAATVDATGLADPAVHRALDAGLLAVRRPRSLQRVHAAVIEALDSERVS